MGAVYHNPEAVCHNPEAHISKERKYLKFVIE